MSINSLLETGKVALNAQKLALEVTGENITNVNTPGYSRQTTILETAPTTLERGFPLGSGVEVAAVQRTYDAFLARQINSQNAINGQGQSSNAALQRVQTLFNEFTTSGLGQSLQGFFNAWQDLTANPQGVPERQAVLSQGQQVVDNFHNISTSLNGVKNDMDFSLSGTISTMNNSLQQIATLNREIKVVEIQSGGNANEMRDQRDLLIRQLSQSVGVTFAEQPDGQVNVTLPNGDALVTGDKAATFSLQPNAANSGYNDVMLTPPGSVAAINETTYLESAITPGGTIAGSLTIRDTKVNRYLSDLDELAANLATQVNTVHAAGFGLTGAQNNFFTPPASAPPVASPGYSASIALNISSVNDVAAADADPTTASGPGNNVNAQNIADIYNKPVAMSSGTMTLESFYNALVGKVGVDVQKSGQAETQSSGVLQQLDNLRESNSGVSLDEELSNLVKYQKAYEGAAKLINVGTDMLDTVIGLIR